MQDIRIDDDGNQHCWKHGGKGLLVQADGQDQGGRWDRRGSHSVQSYGTYNRTGNAPPFKGTQAQARAAHPTSYKGLVAGPFAEIEDKQRAVSPKGMTHKESRWAAIAKLTHGKIGAPSKASC